MSGFNLEDYVQVNERIEKFYAKYPDGSLQAEIIELNETRVVMRAYAYRNPDDPRPGIGHSMLTIPGKTPYTKDSEVENAETSAVGRAIAMLGFEVKKSIASRNELEAKGAREDTNGGLIGTAVKQKAMTTDFLVRQSPDGPFLGFRLASGAGAGVICEVRGPLAEALVLMEDQVIGQRVQVWGSFVQYEPPTVKHPYRAFRVTRIETPTGTIPAIEGGPGDAPQAQAAEADDAGTRPSKTATTDVPSHSPDAAGGNVQEPDRADPPAPTMADDQCGADSPYGDGEHCELLKGHKGAHAVLSVAFPEKWEAA